MLLALVAIGCSTSPEGPPPANGVDLAVAVSPARAEIGSSATYQATVWSVGTQDSTHVVTVGAVAPPGQTFWGASGPGWTCTTAPESVSCTNPSPVPAGTAMPPISLTTAVSGAPYAASMYAVVHVDDDVNRPNDVGRGVSTVVPSFGPDEL